MPTKKQRRRQQKSRRHEYEYVYVDDEGNEVEIDTSELRSEKAEKSAKPAAQSARGAARRPTRTVQPPSWRRVGRRAILVGPVLVIALLLLNRNTSPGQRVAPAIIMLAFFLPFSY